VQVVVLTSLGDPKNVVDAYYKGGTNAYLVKPVDRVMLLEVIRGAGVQIEPCWSCVP
jgi:two-component system, chemotaxis family, chemotaxis protein CheY